MVLIILSFLPKVFDRIDRIISGSDAFNGGVNVGASVGGIVGFEGAVGADGASVGLSEGTTDGASVLEVFGLSVGLSDGTTEGASVGAELGISVGYVHGANVGQSVHETFGSRVG